MKNAFLKKATLTLVTSTTALFLGESIVKADSYTLQTGDSFFSVAQRYGMNPYDLAAINGKDLSSLLLPGDSLTVIAVNQPTSLNTAGVSQETGGNTYPIGQCTWGVKELATWAGDWWGNGGDWASSAAAQGHSVGSVPTVGSIMCWTDGGYGHVAYVTAVGADGQIQVLESNYKGQQWIDNYRGWFDPNNSGTPGSISYIYPY